MLAFFFTCRRIGSNDESFEFSRKLWANLGAAWVFNNLSITWFNQYKLARECGVFTDTVVRLYCADWLSIITLVTLLDSLNHQQYESYHPVMIDVIFKRFANKLSGLARSADVFPSFASALTAVSPLQWMTLTEILCRSVGISVKAAGSQNGPGSVGLLASTRIYWEYWGVEKAQWSSLYLWLQMTVYVFMVNLAWVAVFSHELERMVAVSAAVRTYRL